MTIEVLGVDGTWIKSQWKSWRTIKKNHSKEIKDPFYNYGGIRIFKGKSAGIMIYREVKP